MNKLLVYGLSGVLGGVLATVALLLATIKAAPQTVAQLVPSQARFTLANSLVADRPADLVPGGGMGQFMMADPDRHFIVMMVPHHKDAIAMAELALAQAKRPEIKTLAQTIKTTQTRENQQMAGWYQTWYGTAVPDWQPGQGQMMGRHWPLGNVPPGRRLGPTRLGQRWNGDRSALQAQGIGQMANCMNRTDLSALRNAADFDRAFIEQMIPHHEMGVMMAQMLQNRGQHPELQTLAKAIITSQTAEIQQMQTWHQTWYGKPSAP